MIIGYGLCFGQNETKAISMGGIDRSLRKGNDDFPCQSQEFVLHHTAGTEAWGSIQATLLPSHAADSSASHLIREAVDRWNALATKGNSPSQTKDSLSSA